MSTQYGGLASSPGVGIGTAVIYRTGHFALDRPGSGLAGVQAHDPDFEWQHFLAARRQVDDELARLEQSAQSLVAELFAAHRLILQDETLEDAVRSAIYESQLPAAGATFQAVTEMAELMAHLDDEYFAGRTSDVLDIGQRLLVALGATVRRPRLDTCPANTILIADDLTPSDVAMLQPENVLGIALAGSTPTAHSAILARSLGIPLVCGLGPAILRVQPQRPAVVDGNRGLLILEPDAAQLQRYYAARQDLIEERALAARFAHEPALTRDGILIPVLANANSPEDVLAVRDAGAEGIGLLRTEFLFQGRAAPPSLEEQADTYRRFMRQLGRGPLIVRALDAGGDKPVRFYAHPREDNPFLGLRGIRLLLDAPDLLLTQYRALQMAAAACRNAVEARFLLPMVSTVDELRQVRALLDEAAGEGPRLKLGAMIEVPSAALIARSLVPWIDFFSIGTNDLAQYTLASDRTHRTVGALADPLHPAVLRLIQHTCAAAQEGGRPVTLCGELAGNAAAAPLLVGLGVHELSAPVPAVPLVKASIRRFSMGECRALAERALDLPDAASVQDLLQ